MAKSQNSKSAISQTQPVKFNKPNGDYYKLDLIVRETILVTDANAKNYNRKVTTENIVRDYKAYLKSVCGNEGMGKYIHGLIEKDAKKNGYKFD